MDQFVQGRNDPSVTVLFQNLVPCVVGKKKFKVKMTEPLTTDAEIWSVSNEAFTLLLLENQYDQWTDIHQQREKKTTAAVTGRLE